MSKGTLIFKTNVEGLSYVVQTVENAIYTEIIPNTPLPVGETTIDCELDTSYNLKVYDKNGLYGSMYCYSHQVTLTKKKPSFTFDRSFFDNDGNPMEPREPVPTEPVIPTTPTTPEAPTEPETPVEPETPDVQISAREKIFNLIVSILKKIFNIN